MGLSDVSKWCQAAIEIIGFAVGTNVVAISTINWYHYYASSSISVGLWSICIDDKCHSITTAEASSALLTSRAFALLGFFAGIGCIVALILFIFKTQTQQVRIIAFICSILAALCAIIGIVVFSNQVTFPKIRPGYSTYLIEFSAGSYICVSIAVLIDIVKHPVQPQDNQN